LTLSVDKDTIQMAKTIASENNISVSKLFKNLISEVTEKRKKKEPLLEEIRNTEVSDWIKGIVATDHPIPDFDHKAEYHKHLEDKYGL
jgi:hypothetical protein